MHRRVILLTVTSLFLVAACDQTAGFGGYCWDHEDCDSGLRCITDKDANFCSKHCFGDSNVCPYGHICPSKYGGLCIPEKSKNEKCFWDYQCVGSLVCNEALNPPICVDPGDEGTTCAYDTDCAGQLRCNDGTNPPECQPLYAGKTGDPCYEEEFCGEGLFCKEGYDGPGTCQMRGNEGDHCNANHECVDGLFCDDYSFWAPHECVPQGDTGVVCWSDDECLLGQDCIFLNYSQGVCAGECETSADCPLGAVCVLEIDSRCQPPAKVGELCYEDDHCHPDLQCDPDNLVCF